MKIPHLFLAALLLIAISAPSLAGAATAPQMTTPAPVPTAGAELPFCLKEAPQLTAAPGTGVPVPVITFPFPRPKCGSCSVTYCQGIDANTPCANGLPNGGGKVCYDYATCTDGTLQCACGQAQ